MSSTTLWSLALNFLAAGLVVSAADRGDFGNALGCMIFGIVIGMNLHHLLTDSDRRPSRSPDINS